MSDYVRSLRFAPSSSHSNSGTHTASGGPCERLSRFIKSLPVRLVYYVRTCDPTIRCLSVLLFITLGILGVILGQRSHYKSEAAPPGAALFNNVAAKRRTAACTMSNPCSVAIIADLDVASRGGDPNRPEFHSLLGTGQLALDAPKVNGTSTALSWHATPLQLTGTMNEAGRGLELSELLFVGDGLYSFCDRTGIVYELVATETGDESEGKLEGKSEGKPDGKPDGKPESKPDGKPETADGGDAKNLRHESGHAKRGVAQLLKSRPRQGQGQGQGNTMELKVVPISRSILVEADTAAKGMKIEWATVKDSSVYIGSFGKEFTSSDGRSVRNTNNMNVIKVTEQCDGACSSTVERLDWTANYEALRVAVGARFPGYLINEAVNWSPAQKRWVVLPRRVSVEPYDEVLDETRGSNTVIFATEDFGRTEVVKVKDLPSNPDRGFSSFKFVPGTDDHVVVALRSSENSQKGIQATFVSVFNVNDGTVLVPETEVPYENKFEGIEIW